MALVHRVVAAANPLLVDGDDFARLDVAHELGADDVEGAGLAAEHVALAQPPNREGAQSVLVAAGIDAVARHNQEGEGPFEHVQRIDNRVDARTVVVAGLLLDEVGQNLAVGGRLEEASLVLEILAQQLRVDDVAVVRQGEVARVVAEEEGLDVLRTAAARGRIAHVADGHAAAQGGELRLVEDLGHQSGSLDAAEVLPGVDGHDAGALLPAVLQGVESVVGQRGRIGHPVDTEDAALLVQLALLNLLYHVRHRFFSVG